ncbi:MAG: 16S rRNA (guanine(527)-N(7))-methyltransferase RsmG [Clostridia bacterium]|nr:16S rRNA (guanine(527)-N(7))-methyltransferase RsmG [Clostridia bacterium]
MGYTMFAMEKTEFTRELCRVFALCDIPRPSEEQAALFYRFAEHLTAENERYNLTAITEPRAVILRHFADSACLCRFIPNGATLLDVGCGAGFPTLPLTIMRPDIKITAMDATKKRVDFVSGAAELLGLTNVTAVCGRAEDLAKTDLREHFDCVTARAVAELRVLSELCIPFLRVGGLFLSMKAKNASEELAAAQAGIGTLGARLTGREDFSLTDGTEELSRTALLFKKGKSTPDSFPRSYARILKKPL